TDRAYLARAFAWLFRGIAWPVRDPPDARRDANAVSRGDRSYRSRKPPPAHSGSRPRAKARGVRIPLSDKSPAVRCHGPPGKEARRSPRAISPVPRSADGGTPAVPANPGYRGRDSALRPHGRATRLHPVLCAPELVRRA